MFAKFKTSDLTLSTFHRFGLARKSSYDYESTPQSPFLVSIINLYSVFGIVPFRVTLSEDITKYYVAKTSIIRYLYCAVHQFCVVAVIFTFMYPTANALSKARFSPFVGFQAVYVTGVAMGTVWVFKTGWFNKKEIVKLCNITSIQRNALSSTINTLLTVGIDIWALANISFHTYQALYEPERYYGAYRSYSLVKPLIKPLFEPLGLHPVQFLVTRIGKETVEYFALLLHGYYFGHYHLSTHLFPVLALTAYYFATYGLQMVLDDNKVVLKNKNIRSEYEKFKKALDVMRSAYGGCIFIFYLVSISYLTRFPAWQKYFWCGTWFERTEFMNTSITIILAVYFAMSVNMNNKIKMYRYISKQNASANLSNVSDRESNNQHLDMTELYYGLRRSTFGVHCSWFTFTKGFVKTNFAFAVSYGFVIMQSLPFRPCSV